MSKSISITIEDKVTPEILHRFRNFGEDVWRELKDECNVDLDEIDRSTNAFFVCGIKTKMAKRTLAKIENIAEEHNLQDSVTCSLFGGGNA